MFILTLNCGSSSAKYQVYDWDNRSVISVGIIERIGQEQSSLTHKVPGRKNYEALQPCPDHVKAISWIMETLIHPVHGCLDSISAIGAAGHRVVHGGETFTQSVAVDAQVLTALEACSPLAPLHNPANIAGIRAAQKVLPNIPHCAVLDTAWHQTMPQSSYLYALPYTWYKNHKIRRYGFHGTSYIYTAKRAAVLLGKAPAETNLIIAHIGNGSSICAVKKGVSFDTSMGFTPLEGLIMGTRSGDIDPAIVTYMMRETGMNSTEMENTLNKKSGVLGISEHYIDRRDIHKNAEDGDERCKLAMAMECYRIKKYIGAYSAALSRVDAIVFTAGVGEMNPTYRWKALHGLSSLGIKIDREKNELSHTRNGETCISADNSPVKIYVIPTDEELVITEDAHALMSGTYDTHTRFRYSFQSPNYRNKARDTALKNETATNPKLETILAQPVN
ncbi:MAG: propionate kinase [Spirochaeta sp. LUC14_002_19_P3]|nr:MAG: propionate kinase [Spirochaeta sp. LUC14_002_19_P3]